MCTTPRRRDPAGVNRPSDEWVCECEEGRSRCESELKSAREREKGGVTTGLGEAAQPTEAASSPTDVTSWGDGSRADGGGGSEIEGEDAAEESIS